MRLYFWRMFECNNSELIFIEKISEKRMSFVFFRKILYIIIYSSIYVHSYLSIYLSWSIHIYLSILIYPYLSIYLGLSISIYLLSCIYVWGSFNRFEEFFLKAKSIFYFIIYELCIVWVFVTIILISSVYCFEAIHNGSKSN